MFVSRFQQASKKNFGFWDFWFQVCAHLIEILRLSGYFIQLLRYTAPPDARSTTVRLRSVETASLPMA